MNKKLLKILHTHNTKNKLPKPNDHLINNPRP